MCPAHVRTRAAIALVLTLGCAGASASLGAQARATKRDADLLKQKVAAIQQRANAQPSKEPHRTTVTEGEVNSYLAFDAKEQIPVGVVSPSMTILGTGRISGRAVVDLDVVRKSKNPTSLLDPMNYLTGRLPVTATGVLTTSNGVGHFALESASVSSVPIPKFFLQEIISYYSRTADKPGGIGLDDPFALPARIREIHVQKGQAIIVQ
jgi:hypothetical protein